MSTNGKASKSIGMRAKELGRRAAAGVRRRPWVSGFVALAAIVLTERLVMPRQPPGQGREADPGQVHSQGVTQGARGGRPSASPRSLVSRGGKTGDGQGRTGVYQIGEVQARSWMVRFTVGALHAGGCSAAGSALHT